ncbi:MAG: hypothetical protein AAF487_05725 [Bacteroidota bacterium]
MYKGFNDLVRNIFSERTSGEFERRKLVRSERYSKEFEIWKEEKNYKAALQKIEHLYFGSFQNPNFFVSSNPSSNGFYFLIQESQSVNYSFTMDYLKEQVLKREYILNRAVELFKEQRESVSRVHQYYLKPRLKFRHELPYEQLYGNVFLEYAEKDNRPFYFKLQANTYSDRNYKLPKPFVELLEGILKDE